MFERQHVETLLASVKDSRERTAALADRMAELHASQGDDRELDLMAARNSAMIAELVTQVGMLHDVLVEVLEDRVEERDLGLDR
jgi:hypothetical protein